MGNIDLDKITEEHIRGTWEVKERQIANSNYSNPFSTCRIIEIQNNLYTATNGKKRKGNLSIVRENEIVYNPQLKFFDLEKQIANAIITRLYVDVEGKLKKCILTLYFTTGLELILQKQNAI